jgi:hypothetical protein
MKKVSFDFDGCLGDRSDVQEYCKDLLKRSDVEVWIVTSRPEFPEQHFPGWDKLREDQKWSNDDSLFPLASELGIPRERIVFTWWNPKAEWFAENGKDFVFHLDDDTVELREIAGIPESKLVGICCYGSGNWEQKCERVLQRTQL